MSKIKNINNVELVIIHIPKSGGHTIYKTFKTVYKNKLDIPRNRKEYFLTYPPVNSLINIIPDHVRVIYGHFEYKRIKDIHEKYNSKIITWLRNPVDRVISNYFYRMMKTEMNINPWPNIAYTLDTSLLDFARESVNINLMSKFLEGIEPEELYFIGTLENIDEDLKIISRMLNLRGFKTGYYLNNNESYKKHPTCKTKIITTEMRKIIAELNREDMELYQKAIGLRRKYIKLANLLYLKHLIYKWV